MRHYCYFETVIGDCGLLWNETAIERVRLPEKSETAMRRILLDKIPKPYTASTVDAAPDFVRDAIERLQTLLSKGQADLAPIPLDLSQCTPFFRKVYEAARLIPPGQTSTYGALAQSIGSPGSARAIGQAMGKNPFPLIVPCHRVMAAGGRMGGFSAFGGIATKQQILSIEAAAGLDWVKDYPGAAAQAIEHLKKQDETLAALIETVGACGLNPKRGTSVFAALSEAIIYQQLHGKAAATIFKRFRDLFPGTEFPSPKAILNKAEDELRGAGLSRSKMLSIKDLAEKIQSGLIPEMDQLQQMSDSAVIEVLTQVRGIGPWTAEMLLIFDLGRVDILPVSDYGVRKGYAVAFRKRDLPSLEALSRYGERWKPYRSLASWYLWRAADMQTTKG